MADDVQHSILRLCRRWSLVALTVWLLPAVALADDVSQWLQQLDASERAVRRQAEQRLFDAGPRIFEQVPDSEDLSPAQAAALKRVRQRLVQQGIERAQQASNVAIDQEISLTEAAAKIQAQTGNRVDLSSMPDEVRQRSIRLREERTFWSAVRALADRAEGTLALDTETRVVQIVAEEEASPLAVDEAGPYLIRWMSLEPKPLPGDADRQLLRARLEVWPEPRVDALFLTVRHADLSLRVKSGAAVDVWNPQAVHEIDWTQNVRGEVTIDFVAPAETSIDGAIVTGEAEVIAAAFMDTLVFPAEFEQPPQQQRRGDLVVTLRPIRRPFAERPRQIEIAVDVKYLSGVAFESYRQHVLHRSPRLRLDGGEELVPEQIGWDQTSPDGVSVTYRFERPAEKPQTPLDAEFLYRAPTSFVTQTLTFELPRPPRAD